MDGQSLSDVPTVLEDSSTPTVCARCGQIHARCSAHARSKDGAACTRWPAAGMRVCYVHGAKAPAAKRAAAARLATAAVKNTAAIYGVPRRVDPAQGLIEEYWRTAGIIHGLEPIVAGLTRDELTFGTDTVTETATAPNWGTDADGSPATQTITIGDLAIDVLERALSPSERRTVAKAGPSIWLRLLNEERDRFARRGVDIVKLGLEAQRDAYVREQAAMLADVLGQLNLTKTQRAQARDLLRQLDERAGGR